MGARRGATPAYPRDQSGSALRVRQGRLARMPVRAIITGATGMVGEGVLLECLAHPAVEQVLVINRKPGGVSPVGMDKDAYRRVTHDLTLNVAQTLARLTPDMAFCYVTGAGTDSSEQ